MTANSYSSPFYKPNDNSTSDNYESTLFLRMRSLARAAFIFGFISLIISILIPPLPVIKSIADTIVVGYSATLVLLSFLANLAFLQQLTPMSYRLPESISNIKFWSIIEAFFFGLTLFFLLHIIRTGQISININLTIAVAATIIIVGSSFYFQSKAWESHHRLIVTDLVNLINEQDDKKAIELLVKVYDYKIENNNVVELPPTSSVLMLRIIWYRFAFLCIAAIVATVAFNLL